jgi:hypothetical protein
MATVIVGEIERAHRLFTESRIFMLGTGWELKHDLVPLAATAGESRPAHKRSVVLSACDEQFVLGGGQRQHAFTVDESNRFKVVRRVIAVRWARIEHERGGPVRGYIPSPVLVSTDRLQLPVRRREWAPEDEYPGAAPRRGCKRIWTGVTQGIRALCVAVSNVPPSVDSENGNALRQPLACRPGEPTP